MKCHFCKSTTHPVVDFGPMPIANQFRKPDALIDGFRFNLSTSFCPSCFLFQIDEQPAPEMMFHEAYPFFTGLSTSMRKHFEEFAKNVLCTTSDTANFVVEIGSNDGTMLQEIKKYSKQHLGVDPSENVVKIAQSKGLNAISQFFNRSTASQISSEYGRADYILAANVICHIKDLSEFIDGINELLTPDGKFIFEEPYLLSMLEKTSYDQIYDEHVYIFGALSVEEVFSRKGLYLVDAIPQETHGGSMRYVVTKNNTTPKTENLNKIIKQELEFGLGTSEPYTKFGEICQIRRMEFLSLLNTLKSENKSVAGYAATSKSTTVLNFCGIDSSLIKFIIDSTPEKQNCVTPASRIPIVSMQSVKDAPDYVVLFAWNHQTEILAKERHGILKDSRWIRFVPNVEVFNNA